MEKGSENSEWSGVKFGTWRAVKMGNNAEVESDAKWGKWREGKDVMPASTRHYRHLHIITAYYRPACNQVGTAGSLCVSARLSILPLLMSIPDEAPTHPASATQMRSVNTCRNRISSLVFHLLIDKVLLNSTVIQNSCIRYYQKDLKCWKSLGKHNFIISHDRGVMVNNALERTELGYNSKLLENTKVLS